MNRAPMVLLNLVLIAVVAVAGVSAASAAPSACVPGNPCEDGNPCTLDDVCNAQGVCTAGHLPPAIRYCSDDTIAIPGGPGASNPYPSILNVGGGSSVCKVTFVLSQLAHTNPDDLDIMLSGPAGQNAKIFSDVGGTQDTFGVSLTLDDSASQPVPDGGPVFAETPDEPLGGGTYRPTDVNDGPDTFPAPAPTPLGGSALSVFNGTNPNGAWKLWVVDDRAGDSGTLRGWCMRVSFLCSADAQCDDGDGCTIDTCAKGECAHSIPEPEPPEVPSLQLAANKQTLSWPAVERAMRYDVVRGSLSALPVGSDPGSESCFNNVTTTSITDAAVPASGTGYWYLVRGGNCYDEGPFGTRSNGLPQVTFTCP